MTLELSTGPLAGQQVRAVTGADGWASLTVPAYAQLKERDFWEFVVVAGLDRGIKGEKAKGKAQAVTCQLNRRFELQGSISFEWPTDFANLRVVNLHLPFVFSGPDRDVRRDDFTANTGTQPVPPTVTRYFISESEELNPATAKILGQQTVPTLAPQQVWESGGLVFRVPRGAGDHHQPLGLAAAGGCLCPGPGGGQRVGLALATGVRVGGARHAPYRSSVSTARRREPSRRSCRAWKVTALISKGSGR